MTKQILIKSGNTWQKVSQDDSLSDKSWSRIRKAIDTLIDEAVYDYTILHKPFAPILRR